MGESTTLRRDPLLGVVASRLGWTPPLRYLLRRHRVLAYIAKLPPGDLLEVGCGAGALLDEMGRAGWRATGLDDSAPAMQVASALRDASGGKQSLRSEPDPRWHQDFDLICALDVLEHIRDDAAALRCWESWLRPGGHLLLSVPAHQRRWSAGDEWAGHYRRYDRANLLGLLQQNGFRVVTAECYGFPLANLTEAVGVRTYRKLLEQRDKTTSKEAASAHSGIERTDATRLFRFVDSALGRIALRGALAMQLATRNTDWGSGYLILALRR